MVAFAAATTLRRNANAQSPDIVLYAAASLQNVLCDIAAGFQRNTGRRVTRSYAASSALAKRIAMGAPADLFISANPEWMDYLEQRNLVKPWSRGDLLGNKLVLIAPANSAVRLAIEPGFPLASALGDGWLAMADPASVPAGMYGKAALTYLGVWPAVASRVAAAEDVRAALLLVARREAPLGIVYATDAAVEPGVRVVGTLPLQTYQPITYPVALTSASQNPDAAALLVYLRCVQAHAQFRKAGFRVLAQTS